MLTRKAKRVVGTALAFCLATFAVPLAADVQRPRFSFLRQNEDWSVLAGLDPAERRPFDAGKFVRLGSGGSHWVSFGGSARGRVERWDNFAFGVPAKDDDTFMLWRVFGHADFHFGRRARLFFEAKSALARGRELPGGERTLDVDSLDLQQGFVDLTASASQRHRVVVRLGRQALLFGKQRLVSPLPWGNTLRSWDGASAIVKSGSWDTSAFWTRPVTVRKHDFNRADNDREFFGAYAKHGGARVAEVYLLGLNRDEGATFNGTSGAEERYTLGGRLEFLQSGPGPRGEAEAAVQFGRIGNSDVRAWMGTLEFAWAAEDRAGSPTFKVALDLASGDRDPGGDVETFNQLFPLGHAWLGMADFVGRQNIVALSAPVSFRPCPRFKVMLSPHLFRRFESSDALYNAGGGVVFPGNAGSSRDVGIELDAVVVWNVAEHVTADGGYARFFAGEFVEQAGGHNDMSFAYAQLGFRY